MSGLGPIADWIPCQTAASCTCPNHSIPSLKVEGTLPLGKNPAFHHLTTTNSVPTAAEDDTIQALIGELESRLTTACDSSKRLRELLSALEEQTVHVNKVLKDLDTESQRLSGAIKDHKRLLCPVRRLPAEILYQIFSYAIEYPVKRQAKDVQPEVNLWWDFFPAENVLWTLELVCKGWRRVVLDSPKLWSFITIVVNDDTFNPDNPRYLLRLGAHLSRVARADSRLSLCICRDGTFTPQRLPPEISTLLLPFACRIHELVIYAPYPYLQNLSPLRNRLTALESLVFLNLRDYPGGMGEDNPEVYDIFDRCTNLRTVTAVDMHDSAGLLRLPWDQLTRFESEHVSLPEHPYWIGPRPRQILQLLENVEGARDCRFQVEGGTDGSDLDEMQGMNVQCKQLSSLDIEVIPVQEDAGPISKILDHITTPALSNLVIEAATLEGVRDDQAAFESLMLLVERSHAPLTALHFENASLDPDHAIRVLQIVPLLTNLRLINCDGLTNEVIQALTVQPGTACVVMPKLTALHLSGPLEFEGDVFAEMVASRWQVAPLKTVELSWFVEDVENAANQEKEELEVSVVKKHLSPYCEQGLTLVTSIE